MHATGSSWLPVVFWAAFLLWLGDRPLGSGVGPAGIDKVAHVALYGVLGSLAGRAWRRAGRQPAALLVLLLATAVGAVDELHQRSVPGRSADPVDFMADVAGVAAGFALVARRRKRRVPNEE